jgi:hypothetical protein
MEGEAGIEGPRERLLRLPDALGLDDYARCQYVPTVLLIALASESLKERLWLPASLLRRLAGAGRFAQLEGAVRGVDR